MSLKQNFINYVESNFEQNPLPKELSEYWEKFKGNSTGTDDKPLFTETGKNILLFLQEHNDEAHTWTARNIAEGLFASSRTISGAIRKLVTDGFVEKVGTDPVIYCITEKGLSINISKE